MAQHEDVRGAGERVDELLAQLRGGAPGPRAAAIAEDLVRTVVGLYGEGLSRIVHIAQSTPDGTVLAALVDEPLVESLLLVHDLHPLDVPTRVRRALHRLEARLTGGCSPTPQTGSGCAPAGPTVEYLGLDDLGRVRVRVTRSGCGTEALRRLVEQTVGDAAPDAAGVTVEEAEPAPPLLQIGRRQ
jgi:hypothetical protein